MSAMLIKLSVDPAMPVPLERLAPSLLQETAVRVLLLSLLGINTVCKSVYVKGKSTRLTCHNRLQ